MRLLVLLPITLLAGLLVAVVAIVLMTVAPIKYLRSELNEANGTKLL